ncbi:MAG TPA: GAF domain-containing protein, partial [Anaerolineales bacterium]|nr:GAF domain-containing protein [Anaerolineales bacterium]
MPQLLAGFLFAASLVCLFSFWVVAGLLFWKKGDSLVGVLSFFVLSGIGVGFSFLIPDTSGLRGWVKGLYELHGTLVWPTFFLVLYMFPDGRFAPRWTRFLTPLPFAFFLVAFWYGDYSPRWLFGLALAYIAGGAVSQVYRYKRASSLEQRQQTKWVVFALGLFVIILLTSELIPLLWPSLSQKTTARFLFDIGFNYFLSTLVAALLPVSISFSIFRNRLWDIDIIIRKTLVYAVVIGLLALVYIGGIMLLQEVIAGFGVRQSPAAIVLSTLAIAVLFNLVRRWFRPRVDRLFFRNKYDAEQALTAFAAQTRDEVDMERLSAALVSALEETVHPVRVSLWLEADGNQVAISHSPSSGEHQSAFQARMMEMDITPDDPLRAHLLKESGVVEIDALELVSAALRRLKEAGVKISAPLISQGELIGVLNLGPRRSEQGYSSDDRRLISNLVSRTAPALRVAQLVHQQQLEARRRERIEQELYLARLVQETLLPKDIP